MSNGHEGTPSVPEPAPEKFKKNVVVVGGGYAGLAAAWRLDESFNVTWIERRPCLVSKIGLRMAVRPSWVDLMLIPEDKVLTSGKRIQASVTGVDFVGKKVKTDKGDSIPYDYVVIATGAVSNGPVEPPAGVDPRKFFADASSKIAAGTNIVIIGGGPVGCELAGEIRAKYPNKKVTIVHRSKILCNHQRCNEEDSAKIQAGLTKVGVQVILGESVKLDGLNTKDSFTVGKRVVSLSSGKNLAEVDLVINCSGHKVTTDFMPPSTLNEKKQVKVDQYLQIIGQKDAFAVGDCNDVPEPKTYVAAVTSKGRMGMPPGHADTVYDNIVALAKGESLKPYAPKNQGPAFTMIPLGPDVHVSINAPEQFSAMKAANYFHPGQWMYANVAERAPPVPTD